MVKDLLLLKNFLIIFQETEGDTIIPLKSATEVKRILDKTGKVTIEIGEKMASFSTDNVILSTKLIEGNYPNYRQVIPPSFNRSIEIPRTDFIAKLELVSITLSDASSFIKTTFDQNRLTLEGSSTAIGESKDYIDINYAEEKTEISFNPNFSRGSFPSF